MNLPGPAALAAAMEATWPPAARIDLAPWVLRDGRGGGKRVSAATFAGDAAPDRAEISRAEAAMRDLGQAAIVQVRDGAAALDAALDAAGYAIVDPVTIYAAPVDALTAPSPPDRCRAIWPVTPDVAEVWAAGGIGPARLAVMERVTGPKTALAGLAQGRPAACAFVACDGPIAMLHALEVTARFRRTGLGRALTRAAADWAARHGARSLALAVTDANAAANALYRGLGMAPVWQYHYRIGPGG